MRFLSSLIASALGTLLALGVVVLFTFFFFFALALSSDQEPYVAPGSVLVLELDGPVPERATDDPLGRAFGSAPAHDLNDVKMALRKAATDTRVDAVLLQAHGIQAPWGTLEEIRSELLAFKESGKPLIASSGEYNSGEQDYFLNSTADRIFAAPEGFFEFNGFSTQVAFFRESLEKLDVDVQVVRAGAYKSAVEPFTRNDLSPENREQLSDLLNATNSTFMQAIAESRDLSVDALNRLAAEEATLTAKSALSADLIDDLLYDDEVLDVIKQRLDAPADEELSTVTLDQYARISPSSAGLETGDEGEVAVVYAEGQIVSGESEGLYSSTPTIGSETFGEAMESARASSSTDAVVVRVNSPGGSASASDAMWRAIEQTAREKPVVVSMGGTAASGGYWISTAADTIVADPLTITGSIGVFGVFFDASGLLENKLGVTFDGVQTSPFADLFTGVTDFSEEERALLEGFIDETYATFLEKVAASRDLDVEAVDAVAQGRIWTGARAQEVGLVDVLGGLDRAVAIAAERAGLPEDAYRIRTLPRSKTFFERLNESFYAQAEQAWQKLTAPPFERSLMDQQRFLRTLLREHGTAQTRLPFTIQIR